MVLESPLMSIIKPLSSLTVNSYADSRSLSISVFAFITHVHVLLTEFSFIYGVLSVLVPFQVTRS